MKPYSEELKNLLNKNKTKEAKLALDLNKVDYKKLESDLFFYISGGGQAQASCYPSQVKNISSFKFKDYYILSKEELRRNFKLLISFLCEHALHYSSKVFALNRLSYINSLVESFNFSFFNKKSYLRSRKIRGKRLLSFPNFTPEGAVLQSKGLYGESSDNPNYKDYRYKKILNQLWDQIPGSTLKEKNFYEKTVSDAYIYSTFFVNRSLSKRSSLTKKSFYDHIHVSADKKVLFIVDPSLDVFQSLPSLIKEEGDYLPLLFCYSSEIDSVMPKLYDGGIRNHSFQESINCVIFVGKLSDNPRNISNLRCLYRLTTCPVFVLSDVALKGLQSRFFFFNSFNENSDYSTMFEGAALAVKLLIKMYSFIYFFHKKD